MNEWVALKEGEKLVADEWIRRLGQVLGREGHQLT